MKALTSLELDGLNRRENSVPDGTNVGENITLDTASLLGRGQSNHHRYGLVSGKYHREGLRHKVYVGCIPCTVSVSQEIVSRFEEKSGRIVTEA